jgi:hypothetical protein
VRDGPPRRKDAGDGSLRRKKMWEEEARRGHVVPLSCDGSCETVVPLVI